MLPAFKGDMQLHETYSFANNSLPLSTPIVAYGGGSDQSVTADDLRQWQQMSSSPLELMVVEGGGHFYTESHTEEFLAHVKQQLEAALPAARCGARLRQRPAHEAQHFARHGQGRGHSDEAAKCHRRGA